MIDTAAWNEFPAMQTLYIKMAQLVLIVYDVVSPTWKESLIRIINGVRNVKRKSVPTFDTRPDVLVYTSESYVWILPIHSLSLRCHIGMLRIVIENTSDTNT
mgnify:CR=1 FL=1